MDELTGARGREKFEKAKWLINLLTKVIWVLPKSFREGLFNLFRNVNGIIGIGIRYTLLKTIAKNVGDNVGIHPGVYLLNPEKMTFGNNVSIHPMSYIDGTGGISIGNDVSLAHGTTILSTSHNYEDISIPIKDQGIKFAKTTIENNVWIGSKATILYGVTVKKNSIIAASAVVTKDVISNSVVAGVPAVVLKKR